MAATGRPSGATPAEVFALVDGAFGQRRKMLRQALAATLGDADGTASEVLERAGVAPTARAEELSIDDFVRIARTAG